MATDNPTPRMGDINGDISIAPMIIAVELVSSPTQASIDEHASIQKLYPRNETPRLIVAILLWKSDPSFRPNAFWKK